MTKTITWVPPLTALWWLQVTLVYTQFQNDMLTVGLSKSLQTTSTYKSNGNSNSLFFSACFENNKDTPERLISTKTTKPENLNREAFLCIPSPSNKNVYTRKINFWDPKQWRWIVWMILRISIGWFEPVNHLNFQVEYTKTHLKINKTIWDKNWNNKFTTNIYKLSFNIFQQVCEVYNKQNDLSLLRFLL